MNKIVKCLFVTLILIVINIKLYAQEENNVFVNPLIDDVSVVDSSIYFYVLYLNGKIIHYSNEYTELLEDFYLGNLDDLKRKSRYNKGFLNVTIIFFKKRQKGRFIQRYTVDLNEPPADNKDILATEKSIKK